MGTDVKQVSKTTDVDERLAALHTNSTAVRAIASAVEGTLGPKGLNCMLVDRYGDVTITNDGNTILDKIDVNHPAARMVIGIAKAQEEEVGDGTTTATILASALISEAVGHVERGVPITRVIEGIHQGIAVAMESIKKQAIPIKGLDDPLLKKAALVAGRGLDEIADLVIQAAKLVGEEKLQENGFKLLDTVLSKEGAENEVVAGLILDKERMNRQMPRCVEPASILVIDDALEPETIEEEALRTESGYKRYRELQEQFLQDLKKICSIGVNCIIVGKGVHDVAEDIFTEAGILVIRRVSSKDISRVVEHTGARTIKRSGLRRDKDELLNLLGHADKIYQDEKLDHVRILGGQGKPSATILVGASTAEVRDERARIAKDAAAAVQAAILGGVVSGGGAAELSTLKSIQALRESVRGMAAYGVDCVLEALKRPLTQIVQNAGFNPLEKVEDVIAQQVKDNSSTLAIDCETGDVADMLNLGVLDPLPVKMHALKASGEIAEAILRINTIIKKRDEMTSPGMHNEPSGGQSIV